MRRRFLAPYLLLALVTLPACDRPSPSAAPAITTPAPPAPPPESAQERQLKETVKAFHEGIASPEKAVREQALARIACKRDDIRVLFPDYERYWGVIEIGLMDLKAVDSRDAEGAAQRGAVRSVKLVNLRDDSTPLSAKLGKAVPVYRALVECERGSIQVRPLMFVNGRWVWYPNLEKIAATLK